jgi:enoyl-CoA hydratase
MRKWLSDPQTISFAVKDGVARITLNRPDKRNALTQQLLDEVQAALIEADDLKEVGCVVIEGAGRDFCAGYDISSGGDYLPRGQTYGFDVEQYRGQASYDDDAWQLRMRSAPRLQIFDMFKPVIAKVHGNCLAGGTDLALMCDIVIAADDARIGYPATRALGSPASNMWLYHVGPQWAKRMLFTGDTLCGAEAAKIGLVMKSVPADVLDDEVDYLADRIAKVPSDLLAAHKRIINAGLELLGARTLQRFASENDARAHLSSAYAEFAATVQNEGVKAALQRRDGPFSDGQASTAPEAPRGAR